MNSPQTQTLVVAYSWTGTSRRVADMLVATQGWALAEVRDAKGGRNNWRCIVDSLLRRQPAIRYDGPNPSAFKAVVLVSPIWLGSLASPMRTFVSEHAGSLPQVAVVSVMGGRGAPGALAEISRRLGRAPILDAAIAQHEVEDGSCATRLQAFGHAVAQCCSQAAAPARSPAWSARAA